MLHFRGERERGGGVYRCYDLLQNTKHFQWVIIHSVVKKKNLRRADKSVGVFAHMKEESERSEERKTEKQHPGLQWKKY